MASRKGQREEARRQREAQEAAAAIAARRRRMTQLAVGGVLAALIVVAALIAISQSGGDSGGGNASDIAGAQTVAGELNGIPQNGTLLGDPKAKVTVVEFGDPQCPICAEFANTVVPQLIAGPVSDGQAKYEFKPWLIIGPDSEPAADAALAAGKQNLFFNYIGLFYRNQGTENSGYVTDDFLTAIADAADIPDLSQWDSDRSASNWSDQLAAVQNEAKSLGLTGTPSVEVIGPGGKKILPNVPTEPELEAAIRAAG